ncbi:MFS transporter [Burkholderia sp. PAMC 26561]|uniref:MFS transporter n=1 Tax=Burkholderia sp. PAMC 26561 TaxID=1795043 RepID=UPI00076B2C9A|nr:MFS transporter [Burkholderia sp. PAMC 26561]AME28404.1 MFS transporter [Burkholderia sp. PAMC 26561]
MDITHASLSARSLRNHQIFALFLSMLGELFLAGDWYGFAAVIPFISKSLALSPGESGFVQGVFAITYSVGLFVWSPLGRHLSARTLFVLGLCGCGVAMLLQAHVQSYAALIVLRLLIGFFDAAVWVGTMKLIVGWFPLARHGMVMGLLLSAFSFAITLDFAVGIPVSESHGWRVFFEGLGIATFVVGLLGFLSIKGSPREMGDPNFQWESKPSIARHGEAASVWTILRSKWVYIGAIAIFGDTFALAATATWAVPSFIANQGMPISSAALIGTTMGLSQVSFLLLGGWLSDRMTKTSMLKIGAALALVSATCYSLTTIFHTSWVGLIALSAFSGIAVLSGGAIFSLVSEKYGETLAASAIGFAELGGILSTFVAPALMGVVLGATRSFAAAFVPFVVVEALILVFLMLSAR